RAAARISSASRSAGGCVAVPLARALPPRLSAVAATRTSRREGDCCGLTGASSGCGRFRAATIPIYTSHRRGRGGTGKTASQCEWRSRWPWPARVASVLHLFPFRLPVPLVGLSVPVRLDRPLDRGAAELPGILGDDLHPAPFPGDGELHLAVLEGAVLDLGVVLPAGEGAGQLPVLVFQFQRLIPLLAAELGRPLPRPGRAVLVVRP